MKQIPVNEKYALTIKEAAAYFSIGEKKLRRLAEMNTYTHLGLDDAQQEMIRLQEQESARKEIEKVTKMA